MNGQVRAYWSIEISSHQAWHLDSNVAIHGVMLTPPEACSDKNQHNQSVLGYLKQCPHFATNIVAIICKQSLITRPHI